MANIPKSWKCVPSSTSVFRTSSRCTRNTVVARTAQRRYATEPSTHPPGQDSKARSTRTSKPLVTPREPDFADIASSPYAPANMRHPGGVRFVRTRLTLGIAFIVALGYNMFPTPRPLSAEPSSIAERDSTTKRESGVTESSPMRLRMEKFIKTNQSAIVSALEAIDPSPRNKFRIDTWTRPNGGGGTSCVLQDGTVFEKAGVNTSVVYGTLPRAAISKMRAHHKALDPDVSSLEFFAAGLSLVLHPQNPMAPTVHLNYRYFETMDPSTGEQTAWWFGGGTDLTPSYLFDEDAIHFHKTIKAACDAHDPSYYPRFKTWCDIYFRIPHRENESRGVGGIFFDDLDAETKDQEQLFSFIQSCLAAFLPSYLPIIHRRKDMAYTALEKQWQQVRRGRYVEFNLVNDRGTQFGLQTPGARIESILMSLPLTARWMYMHEVENGSREERLLGVLREPKEWV